MYKKLLTTLDSPNILGAGLVWVLSSSVFFIALYRELVRNNFPQIALLAAGTLTVMIAITSLLYARSRAWPPGSIQRRCLFAAEKCFAGMILFALSVFVMAVIIFALSFFQTPLASKGILDWFLSTGVGACCAFYAFYEFIYGLRVSVHRKPWSNHPRQFLAKHRHSGKSA